MHPVDEMRLATRRLIERLPADERLVIGLRFKNEPGPVRNHSEIASALGRSEEWVRRVEVRALRQLRDPDLQSDVRAALQEVARPSVEVRDAIESVKRLEPEVIAFLKEQPKKLDLLPWDVFEHLVAEFLKQQGYDDVRLVGRDASTAADVFACKVVSAGLPIRLFVEVKHESRRAGVEIIEKVAGARFLEEPRHGWSAAMVVALAGFKRSRRYDKSHLDLRNLQLRGKEDVMSWLKGYTPSPQGLWLPSPQTAMPAGIADSASTPKSRKRARAQNGA